MADEQYRWLNRDAAERLLRGESLEGVDADTRAQADRLAEALGALTAEVSPVSPQSAELPGEEAALAAFRSARAARSVENAGAVEPGRGSRTHTSTAPVADAGLVRLGRPGRSGADGRRARWGRPVRFGLVAALAAGMLGGVTVVAGSGALNAFRDDEPEPSATISAAQTPDRPLLSPSPSAQEGDDERGILGDPTPEGSPDASSKGDVPSGEGTGGTDEDGQPDGTGQDEGPTQEWWNSVFSACRDVRDGKNLDADRRRGLEDAAGGKGKGQLKRYCAGVLADGADNPGKARRPGAGTGTGTGTGTSDSGDSTGPSGGDGKNTRSGNDSDGEDDDSDSGKGRGGDGNGKGDGNGRWNGNGKNAGGKNKGGKGDKGHGGNGHRGQIEAVTPIGAGVVGPGASPVSLSPLSRAL